MTFLRIVTPPYCPDHTMQVLILCSIAERKEFGGGSELGAAVDGDDVAGDPALQLSQNEINMAGCRPLICVKTALAAFDAWWSEQAAAVVM